jgi:hypothetical protein
VRLPLVLAALAGGLALAVPAAPASASCTRVPGNDCWMPCYTVGSAINRVYSLTGYNPDVQCFE